jgi:hypothetical protein
LGFLERRLLTHSRFSISIHQGTPTSTPSLEWACLTFTFVHRVIAHPVVVAWHEENLRRELQHREFEDEMDGDEAVHSYFQGHS